MVNDLKKLKFKIATPERVVYESEVESLTCSTELGEVTILPNHIPLVANLQPGELRIKVDGEESSMFCSGGFLEVRPSREVVILADAAEQEHEIDLERAEAARERARQLMSEKKMGEEEYADTLGALERSLVRIKLGRKKKYKDVGKILGK